MCGNKFSFKKSDKNIEKNNNFGTEKGKVKVVA